jgi:hypothetical protein
MNLTNMSDGKKDGLAIMYVKDGSIYPVGLNEEQLTMLDLLLPMAFENGVNVVSTSPLATVVNLFDKGAK